MGAPGPDTPSCTSQARLCPQLPAGHPELWGFSSPPVSPKEPEGLSPLYYRPDPWGGASGAGLTVLLYQPPWENNGGVPFCLPEVPRVRDDGRRHPVQTGHTAVIT